MDSKFLIDFLQNKNVATVEKKHHTYLSYYGLEEKYVYVLKEGIIKTSIILKDGREFNLSYICEPDIISLLRDEVSNYTSAPFNIRIESEKAVFYTIPRLTFWNYVNNDEKLQAYVKDYYRNRLMESINNRKNMVMNGKKGALCAFLYDLVHKFGKKFNDGYLIDFSVTNEDIAGFCGISTRNSVNRILHELKDEEIIDIVDQKIHVKDIDYLEDFALY